eukprot:TRINITY_DN8462_c0_g1_i4.p1 TRINITY_DN8462_c0_g1~~TRINITY_DN8462_c0_g1_i4.p1  ORF type:complete len:129 (+),score=45.14 TRINITY_DN8462_c0_g1_i4:279-665(+)
MNTKLQYSLQVVKASSMTVREQIALFKQAAVIMGPHGAGLSNMMWMAQGSIVIEFPISPNYNVCFGNLARVLGHRYWIVPELRGCYYGKYKLKKSSFLRTKATLAAALEEYELDEVDALENNFDHDEL